MLYFAAIEDFDMSDPITPMEYHGSTGSLRRTLRGGVPDEMEVTLTVNGEAWLVFMCTPEYLDALAVGFLFNEGLIDSAADIAQLRVCPANDNVDVWTTKAIAKPARWRRTSGCAGGLSAAGEEKMKTHALVIPAPPPGMAEYFNEVSLTPAQVNELMMHLFRAQHLHRQSGGVHASALSDGIRLFLSCEDVGRHNTLDKLAGRVMLEKKSDPRLVTLTTGRISSEMLQKAARMGTAVIISCTAATSLAVKMAEVWGLMLIGYARKDSFIVFTHSERIRT